VHAINPLGSCSGRLIEIEDVHSGERFHGSPQRLERVMRTLQSGEETKQ
jgi:hypothetical protein